jgi:hypothetical protein
VTFTAEAFVRIDHLFEQQVEHSRGTDDVVPEKHYRFGGDVLQIGGKLALGW